MVVIAAAAAAADGKRWPGVPPTRKPVAGAPQPINLPTQRDTATWGNKSTLPASNAWASPWPLYHKNDGASVSPSHMDARPSSRGSSTSSSTIGSDFLDLPSYQLPTVASRPLSTKTRSGSLQRSPFPDSFTHVLKAPLRTVGRRAPPSQGKGFSLSLDDFPVLGSTNSASNSQQGKNSGRRPTVGSGMVATQDEQGKNPITGTGEVISSCSYEHESISRMDFMCKGGDHIPAVKLTRGAEKAQLHGPQSPNICTPPPWLDYWHPPPDQPPHENGILDRGEALYGPYKNADPIGFPVESLGQFALNKEAAARRDSGHGWHYPNNRDPLHPHIHADSCVLNQPCHVLGKVENGPADVLEIEKQPIIKKDLALLEKIKCLNNKARILRALNMSNPSSSLTKESKVEHPKSICVEADHVAEYVPFSAATSEIGPAFDKLTSVPESSNSVPTTPSNGPAKGVTVVGLSEEQVTKFSEARKVGKSANCHAYGRGDISRYGLDCSAKDMPTSITGHGWEEYSMVDSLRGVVMTDAQQDQLLSRNTPQQAHLTVADKVQNWLDCEVQHSRMRYLSSQAAKQLQDAENWISEQKENATAKLEELRRYQSIQIQKSNDAPPYADNLLYRKQKTQGGRTTKHASLMADTRCSVSADGFNAPQPVNGLKIMEVPIGSSPASNTSGVGKGLWIDNVMSSAKNTEINMIEHIAHKSTSSSHDNSTPEHLQMENRRRHFDSLEGNFTKSKTSADTKAAEPKSDAVRPAATPVFGNEKNSTKVSTVYKTHVPCVAINGSMIPAKVTPVTRLIVGSIMLDDVALASVNPEWAAAAKEVHDTATGLSSPQQVKKSEKNQHGLQPVEDSVSNYSVLCKPIKQTGKKEEHAEGGPNGMAVAAATESSGSHGMVLENVATKQQSEIGWYAHKPLLYEELQQQNLWSILPGENQTISYDNWANSNLETKCHDKAPASSTEAKVRTELNDWLDRKTTLDHQGRPQGSWEHKSDGLASVVRNLADAADYFNVANAVQESSDQWQQGKEQFESKAPAGTEDHSKLSQMAPSPDNTWENHRATDSPRYYHVEGQRNGWSRYGYKERAGRGRFFHESPAPSRLHWMPKYTFHPPSDAQYGGVSKWLHDSRQVLSGMDNSQGSDSKPTHQIAGRDGGIDLQGREGNVSMSSGGENLMIWNETEWEYQQPFPAPHRLGQQHGGRGRGTYEDSQRGRGRHSEYHYLEPARSRDAVDVQWNPGGEDDHRRPVSSRTGEHMERRYYI